MRSILTINIALMQPNRDFKSYHEIAANTTAAARDATARLRSN